MTTPVKLPQVQPSLQLLNPNSNAKFIKKITDIPISVDFPRLFSMITVLSADGSKIWDNRPAAKMSDAFEFLIFMAQNLRNGYDTIIQNRFGEFFPDLNLEVTNSQVNVNLKNFFTEVLGEDNGIIGILKCINQDIIFPAVSVLRFAFFVHQINYFEIRGKWDVIIQFNENNVTVTNKRWERISPDAYNFCWEVSFILNLEATKLVDTKLIISQIDTVKEVSEDLKSKFFEIVTPFLSQNR